MQYCDRQAGNGHKDVGRSRVRSALVRCGRPGISGGVAAAVLAAYLLVFLAASLALTARRDITS
jgi:hypothetical protein